MEKSSAGYKQQVNACRHLLNIDNLMLPKRSPGIEHLCNQLARTLSDVTGLPTPEVRFVHHPANGRSVVEYCTKDNTILIPDNLGAARSAEIVFRAFAYMRTLIRALVAAQSEPAIGKAFERYGVSPHKSLEDAAKKLKSGRSMYEQHVDRVAAANIVQCYLPVANEGRYPHADELDSLRSVYSRNTNVEIDCNLIGLEARRVMVQTRLEYARQVAGNRLAQDTGRVSKLVGEFEDWRLVRQLQRIEASSVRELKNYANIYLSQTWKLRKFYTPNLQLSRDDTLEECSQSR